MVRTDTDTLAAVDAAFGNDIRLFITHPDCFGRTALDAVDTTHTFVAIERYRVKKLLHAKNLLSRMDAQTAAATAHQDRYMVI